jgi:hypothetical protein
MEKAALVCVGALPPVMTPVSEDPPIKDIPRDVWVFKLRKFGLPPVLIFDMRSMLHYWRQ